MWLWISIVFGVVEPLPAQNQPAVNPSAVNAGGGRSSASNITIDSSIGEVAGVLTNPGGVVQCYVGFPGQTIKIRPILGRVSFSFPTNVIVPLFGEDDLFYRVQASTTLLTNSWTTIWTGRTVNGVATVTHPGVAFSPYYFYRANQLP